METITEKSERFDQLLSTSTTSNGTKIPKKGWLQNRKERKMTAEEKRLREERMIVDFALDPGTGNTIIIPLNHDGSLDLGNMFDEPSVIILKSNRQGDESRYERIAAIGNMAKPLINQISDDSWTSGFRTLQPIVDGLIQHDVETAAMWKMCLDKVCEKMGLNPKAKRNLIITVPLGLTPLQEKTVSDVAMMAGANEVEIVSQVFCAVLGGGLYDPNTIEPTFGIDIGHGTSQLLLFTGSGTLKVEAVQNAGGGYYTEALQTYLLKTYGFQLDPLRAEKVKIQIGAAMLKEGEEDIGMTVPAIDKKTGKGGNIFIRRSDTVEAFRFLNEELVLNIREVCNKAPNGLVADFSDEEKPCSFFLGGGGTLLHNLDEYLRLELNYRVLRVHDPLHAIAIGAAKIMANSNLRPFHARKPFEWPTETDPCPFYVLRKSAGFKRVKTRMERRGSRWAFWRRDPIPVRIATNPTDIANVISKHGKAYLERIGEYTRGNFWEIVFPKQEVAAGIVQNRT